ASPNVEAVSSIDEFGALSGFAQRQDGILAAHGESIVSAIPDHVLGWDGTVDDMGRLSGTSMATPQIAAASVLIRQALLDRGMDPSVDEIMTRIDAASTTSIDPSTNQEFRTIDLQAAVADLLPAEPDGTVEEEPDSTGGVRTVHEVITDQDSQSFVLDLRDGIQLTIGDQVYRLQAGDSGEALLLDASGGADSLHIIGSVDSERLRLVPSTVEATGTNAIGSRLIAKGTEINLRGFEDVTFDGGGGADRATLYDAETDDRLESHPDSAVLSGVGFRFAVNDVTRTYVHATAGGSDTGFLYDSDGDDLLTVQPQFTSLRGIGENGEDVFQSAYGFESVFAYASGGHDVAELQDSEGDDVLTISPTRALVSSDGYQVSTRYFESVSAMALAGGDDLAQIYADEVDSRWYRTNDLTQWSSEGGATRIVRGFERVEAFENFEPVELRAASVAAPLDISNGRDEEDQLIQEAVRSVFDQLGANP
ncbi:MAG: peptidase S8, partial [Planctomycetota bacterium]